MTSYDSSSYYVSNAGSCSRAGDRGSPPAWNLGAKKKERPPFCLTGFMSTKRTLGPISLYSHRFDVQRTCLLHQTLETRSEQRNTRLERGVSTPMRVTQEGRPKGIKQQATGPSLLYTMFVFTVSPGDRSHARAALTTANGRLIYRARAVLRLMVLDAVCMSSHIAGRYRLCTSGGRK